VEIRRAALRSTVTFARTGGEETMTPPETRYAKSGEVRIAYQVVGSGPLDLVYVPGFVSNIELFWETPELAYFLERLAAFSRLILFDKRGTGLSDRDVGIATLEERMDDVRAVMDASRSDRAALFGVSEGGAMSVLFAATYPQRAQALVLYGSYARATHLLSEDKFNKEMDLIDRLWGTGEYTLGRYFPSGMSKEAARIAFARRERQSASPAAVMAIRRMNREIDARHVLPAIRVPTLVMHRVGDSAISVELGREIATNIPGARYVELPGADHIPFYERDITDRMVDEVEEFLTGSRSEPDVDRVLATVMFTDIVDSTKQAADGALCSTSTTTRCGSSLPVSRAGNQELGGRVSGDLRRPGPRGALRRRDLGCGAAARHRGAQRPPYWRNRTEARRCRRDCRAHRGTRGSGSRGRGNGRVEHGPRSRSGLGPALPGSRDPCAKGTARGGAPL